MNQQHTDTPVAYRIHYSADGSLCQTYQAHNAIDTYRAIDPNATVTPLYERPRCPMTDQVNEAMWWRVGNEVYPSEAEAVEAIRQWGPSGAIVEPLYTHPALGVVSDAMVEAACESYWGGGWQEPEHEGIEAARRLDARNMLEAALQAVALPAVPEVPEGESVTLRVAQIADLARFAGLFLAQSPQPAPDELEAEITVYACPDKGVLLDGEDTDPGMVAHYKHIAYYSEYPDEGCIGLGPEIATPAHDQPEGADNG